MLTTASSNPFYQLGGSLPCDASTYVWRQADEQLFQGLRRGEFCYVFNARQMGKSSLRVRTTHRLQGIGIRCAVIDITTIGTCQITLEQWYASILGLLTKALRLEVNLLQWWRDRSHLSPVNRLDEFLDTVLLRQITDPIVIFVDEIDSVLSLPFSTDDFFALIRACYNRRAEQSNYQRLTFALFGVATPTDLVSDSTRTPFNLGQAIELRGFQLAESTPLLAGLAAVIVEPQAVLQRILDWTGGQPFLTQKLCHIVTEAGQQDGVKNSSPLEFVDSLVASRILAAWEAQDEPEHLKTIRDRLLYREQTAGRLLGLYQQLLLRVAQDSDTDNSNTDNSNTDNSITDNSTPGDRSIMAHDSPEQRDLILTGLVEKQGGTLRIKNPIYQHVFNLDWVGQQLANLRPYSQAINAWIISGYWDTSRLLRGQALRDALDWAHHKSLSDLDYRFLAASQERDRQESQRLLEAERLQEVETRLQLERERSLEQRRNLHYQRILLGIVSLMLTVAIALGLFAHRQYQQTAVSELRAIVLSSEALLASKKRFEALLQAIKAKERLQHLPYVDSNLQTQVDAALWRVVLSIQEYNRLSGHTAAVLAVDYSPDGQQIATAGVDGTIKLWRLDGTLLQTLRGHTAVIRAVKFSPDNSLLATGGDDKTIKLWRRDGTLLTTLQTRAAGIWSLDFSPDSSMLISGGVNSPVEVWSRTGQRLRELPGQQFGIRAVAFSPDGQTIAAGSSNTTITLWRADGTPAQILRGHTATVQAIAFSPDNRTIVSASTDGVINLWNRDGKLLKTVQAHNTGVWSLDFSPDGQLFASASRDKTIKLWRPDGTLITTLQGHDAAIWGVAFSPDSRAIASAGAENIAILWKVASEFQRTIQGVADPTLKLVFNAAGTEIAVVGNNTTIDRWRLDGTPLPAIKSHDVSVGRIALSPDGNTLASISEDKTLKLWRFDGTLVNVFRDANVALTSVDWHPRGRELAASGVDGSIWLWKSDGTFLQRLPGHTAPAWDVQFSPDGQLFASASNDATVRLWRSDGTLLKILKSHQAAVWRVAFSPDGYWLASSSGDATVKLWTRAGDLSKTLVGHRAAVWGLAFSPDHAFLATSSIDETIKLWTPEGQLITTLEGHQSGVRSLAFHPHLPILASAGDDQIIMLWNIDKILQLDPLTYACAWAKDYLRLTRDSEQKNLCASYSVEIPKR